jgi:hypothetical protein
MTYPHDLVAFTEAAANAFGRNQIRWTYLTVASVPGYQLGESPAQEAVRRGLTVEVFDSAALLPRARPSEPKQERRNPTAKREGA